MKSLYSPFSLSVCFLLLGASAWGQAPPVPNATQPSSIADSSFIATWDASSGATEYFIDVATDPAFTSLVVNNLAVGNVLTYPVSTLSPGMLYYYQVRAANAEGTSGNSNAIMVNTTSAIHNVTQSTFHPTIQAGVDAATANDQISVGAGTYTGPIAVSKSLTLKGTNATIEAPPDFGTNAAYNHTLTHFNPERAVVYIGAGGSPINVVMDGFVVDGKRLGPHISQSVGYAGILVEQCVVTITNNTVRNVLPSLADSASSTWEASKRWNGRGIHLRGDGTEGTISNNYLEHINRFHILIDASDDGTAAGVSPRATVSNNTIVGKGIYDGGQKGIWFDNGAWGTASGNTISAMDYVSATLEPDRATCITSFKGSLDPAHHRTFAGNMLSASTMTNNKGFYIQGTDDVVADNTITGFRWGIEVHDGPGTSAVRNAIIGGQVGAIVVSDLDPGYAQSVKIGGALADKNTITGQNPAVSGGSAITVSFRDLSGSSFFSTIPVDATYNDFGVYTAGEVAQRVFDVNDSTSIGLATVNYTPFYAPIPSAPNATAGTVVAQTQFQANWDAVSGAAGYRLDVSSASDFSSYVNGYQDKPAAGTDDLVTGLTANATYHYRVRAENTGGTSGNSIVIDVTTLPNAPSVPTATAATGVAQTQFQATWDPVSGAAGYRLDVASASDFSSYVSGYQDKPIAGTNELVTGVTANTAYHYRVRAENTGGTSGNSIVIDVTTLPNAPSVPTATVAIGVAETQFQATWDPVSGATGYRLDVSTASDFSSYVSGYQDKPVAGT
ncbi:MAG TPA: hypothetical protein DGH68_02030, partial [Bacteroidetes bacterium]|nr:hypothetical protein [Bacteroidota bacterium]